MTYPINSGNTQVNTSPQFHSEPSPDVPVSNEQPKQLYKKQRSSNGQPSQQSVSSQGSVNDVKRDVQSRVANEADPNRAEQAVRSNSVSDMKQSSSLSDAAMSILKYVRDGMSSDDHLRLENGRLYSKNSHTKAAGKWTGRLFQTNHGKTHFWGGARAKKFTAAKTAVLTGITNALGGDKAAAAQIMKPFLKSSRALTQADLTKIIAATDHLRAARAEVQSLVQSGRSELPQVSDLVNNSRPDWTNAFGNFCESKGSTAFADAMQVTQLRDSLRQMEIQGGPDGRGDNRGAVNEVRAHAAELLKQKHLPNNLRSRLAQVVNSQIPSNTRELRTQLLMYRADLSGADSEIAAFRDEFQGLVAQVRIDHDTRNRQIFRPPVPELVVAPEPKSRQSEFDEVGAIRVADIDESDLEPPEDTNLPQLGMHFTEDDVDLEQSINLGHEHDPVPPGDAEIEWEGEVEVPPR